MALEPVQAFLPVNERLVGQLKWMLEEAEAGRLQSMLTACECNDFSIVTAISYGPKASKFTLLGAVEKIKHRVLTEDT